MKSASVPRVVLVTRPTEYEALIAEHGTFEQARFFLTQRDRDIGPLREAHRRFTASRRLVLRSIPARWRRALAARDDLSRFLFEPEDIVVVLGQDGLVANVAKYLQDQIVLGLNPDPERYEGILVPHPPEHIADLLERAPHRDFEIEHRSMVEACLDDGQKLVCLNEIFIGHTSHQSARYWISWSDSREYQSSSGVIISTGTGATGWARSVHRERSGSLSLPRPTDTHLVFFVREAFPSVATGTSLTQGEVAQGNHLEVVSQMNDGGVIFGDGIESDFLKFDWGREVKVGIADSRLHLARRTTGSPSPGEEGGSGG